MIKAMGVVGASVLALGAFSMSAHAVDGRVKACSKFSSGKCTTSQVRTTSIGTKQVQLKGGTWISCKGNCRDTLRRSELDKWTEFKLDN